MPTTIPVTVPSPTTLTDVDTVTNTDVVYITDTDTLVDTNYIYVTETDTLTSLSILPAVTVLITTTLIEIQTLPPSTVTSKFILGSSPKAVLICASNVDYYNFKVRILQDRHICHGINLPNGLCHFYRLCHDVRTLPHFVHQWNYPLFHLDSTPSNLS